MKMKRTLMSEKSSALRQEEGVGSPLDLIIPETLRARHWTGYNRVMATESRLGQGDLLSVHD
jgi:hypothetical protein